MKSPQEAHTRLHSEVIEIEEDIHTSGYDVTRHNTRGTRGCRSLVHQRRPATPRVPNDRVARLLPRGQLVDGQESREAFHRLQASDVHPAADFRERAHPTVEKRSVEYLRHVRNLTGTQTGQCIMYGRIRGERRDAISDYVLL